MQPPNPRAADTDLLYRCLADDPPLRAVVVVATRLVREAVRRHGLTGAAVVALGRGLCSGLLLATVTKGGERVTLQVVGDGPIGSVTVDANDLGQARGYLSRRPAAAVPVPSPAALGERLSISALVGTEGQVIVHRDLGLREIYQGSSALASGEVDEDIQRYLTDSEQMPSVLRAAVFLDEEGSVSWAGGILIQTTPGAGPGALGDIARRVESGWLEHELPRAEELLPPLEDLLDQPAWILEWRRVEFHCPCDAHRVSAALRTLGVEDLRTLLAEEGRVEVTCQFCGRVHLVESAALTCLIEVAQAEQDAAEAAALLQDSTGPSTGAATDTSTETDPGGSSRGGKPQPS